MLLRPILRSDFQSVTSVYMRRAIPFSVGRWFPSNKYPFLPSFGPCSYLAVRRSGRGWYHPNLLATAQELESSGMLIKKVLLDHKGTPGQTSESARYRKQIPLETSLCPHLHGIITKAVKWKGRRGRRGRVACQLTPFSVLPRTGEAQLYNGGCSLWVVEDSLPVSSFQTGGKNAALCLVDQVPYTVHDDCPQNDHRARPAFHMPRSGSHFRPRGGHARFRFRYGDSRLALPAWRRLC